MSEKRNELLKKAEMFSQSASHEFILANLAAHISPEDEVVDLGCGIKFFTQHVNCKKLTGVDVWPDYLEEGDIEADITKIDTVLDENSFDVAMTFDAIEHLTKEEGFKLMKDMEKIARKKVFIMTPVKWCDNDQSICDHKYWSAGNPYQKHKSHWTVEDFEKEGYVLLDHPFKEESIFVMKDLTKQEEQ